MPFDTGLREIFDLILGGVHTAFPAIVQSFDPTTLRCEIQPCLQRRYFNAPTPSNLPVVSDVPVLFPSSGEFTIVFPLEIGSYVLAVCSERALENWIVQGGVVDPGDPRRFDLSDAIAIPGLFPMPNILTPPPIPATMEIRNSTGTVILALTATELQLMCGNSIPPVDYAVKFDQLKIAFDSLKQSLNTHTHTDSMSGTTSVPLVPATADITPAKVATVRLP